MNTKRTLRASPLSAVGASFCCAAPLVPVTLGIGGAWLSALVGFQAARPIEKAEVDYENRQATVIFDNTKTDAAKLTANSYPSSVKGTTR